MRSNRAFALARKELARLPLTNISINKALLAMLYWSEGSKGERSSSLKFANTDPLLISLYLKLLREAFPIDESGLRIALHIHAYHDPEDAMAFWSETTNVPRSQFWKIYVKKRSETRKFRENFKGICSVYYGNRMIRDELLSLGVILARVKIQ